MFIKPRSVTISNTHIFVSYILCCFLLSLLCGHSTCVVFSFNDKYDIIESHTSRKKQFSVTHTSEVNRDSWDYQNKSTHKK